MELLQKYETFASSTYSIKKIKSREGRIAHMKKYPFFLISLIMILSVLPGCGSESTHLTRYSRSSFDLFDTVAVITGFDTSKEAFDAKTDKLLQILEEYHQLYDIYHDYDGINNLKTVNDNAGVHPVPVDERILD